jgi:hypothetical protein
MATEHTFVYDESFTASADLSSRQFYIVASSAAGTVTFCATSTGDAATRAIGILQNNPTSGQAANVRILGKSKCYASSSGAVAHGARVSASTGGGAQTASTGSWVLGTALTASTGGAGQLIEVLLHGPFTYIAGATG